MTISARGPLHWRRGGDFVGSNGSVGAQEDCAKVGFGPFGGIWLEVGLDVDNEGGADCREQTGLETRSALYSGGGNARTHENQGGIEVLVVLHHIFGIVLRRLSLVHGVEVELGVVILDRLEVYAQRLLDVCWGQFGDDNLSWVSQNAPSRVNVGRFPALVTAHRYDRLLGRVRVKDKESLLVAPVSPWDDGAQSEWIFPMLDRVRSLPVSLQL